METQMRRRIKQHITPHPQFPLHLTLIPSPKGEGGQAVE
jgi:hypothetical protein